MIEIVCPSCGSHYQVPDDSIGPEGRRVTCSNCSHKWRAHRETAAAGAAAPADEAGRGSPAEAHPGSPPAAEPAEAGERAEAAMESEPGEVPRPDSRGEQMDAIRRMLDDLKRNAQNEPEPEPEPAAARQTERAQPARRRAEEDDLGDADADPLKSRIAQLDRSGKPAERPSNYDAAKLRRMHEKRAKRLQRAKERQRRSGAFLTGFTLVAVVAAAMVGLYVLQPQIVARSPEMAPAMNEYVGTVDRYRVALDEATADWRAWVGEKVGPVVEGVLGQGDGQSQGQAEGQEEAAGSNATASQ